MLSVQFSQQWTLELHWAVHWLAIVYSWGLWVIAGYDSYFVYISFVQWCATTSQHHKLQQWKFAICIYKTQLDKKVHRDICVFSSAMATIEITCEDCKFDYWKAINFWGNTASYQYVFRVTSVTSFLNLGLTAVSGNVAARVRRGGIAAGWVCCTRSFFTNTPVVTMKDTK